MKTKKCPRCRVKPLDQFYTKISMATGENVGSGYCVECSKKRSKELSKIYYEKNKENKLQAAKDYRRDNPEKTKEQNTYFKKKYREELKDYYVAEIAAKNLKCSATDVRNNTELLEVYRLNMKLKRKIKCHKTN